MNERKTKQGGNTRVTKERGHKRVCILLSRDESDRIQYFSDFKCCSRWVGWTGGRAFCCFCFFYTKKFSENVLGEIKIVYICSQFRVIVNSR
jgi:hypothetical protein